MNQEMSSAEVPIDHVVLLVHGIRTRAFWQDTVKEVFEEISGVRAVPIKYGYFPLLRFLLPGPWRRRPARRIERELRSAREHYPTAGISVICHSFGTYAVCRVLENAVGIQLRHLVLCGAVLPGNYDWSKLRGKVTRTIANDVGVRDVWPVVARLASVGYGASGTFGFGTVTAPDRFFPFRHSDFFKEKFVRDHWQPIIRTRGESDVRTPGGKRPPNPPWISWLGKLPAASAFVTVFIVVVIALAFAGRSQLASAATWAAAALREWNAEDQPAGDGSSPSVLVPGDVLDTTAVGVPPVPTPTRIIVHGGVFDVENRWNKLGEVDIMVGPIDRQVQADYGDRYYSATLLVEEDETVHVDAQMGGYVHVDPEPLKGPWTVTEYPVAVRMQRRTTRAERLFEQAKNLSARGQLLDSWRLHVKAWHLVPKDRYLDALPRIIMAAEQSDRTALLVELEELSRGSAFLEASDSVRFKVLLATGHAAATYTGLLSEIQPGKTYHDFAVEALGRASEVEPMLAQPYQAKMQLELRAEHYFDAAATAKAYFDAARRTQEREIEAFLTEWVTAVEKATGYPRSTPAAYVEAVRSVGEWKTHWKELGQHLDSYSGFFTGQASDVDRRLLLAKRRADLIRLQLTA